MVAPINVTITKDEATVYLDGLVKKMPEVVGNMGWNITQILASSIKEQAGNAFDYPRPYLQTTIEPRKRDKFNYEVHAARYWRAVEHGRQPGKAPPPLGIIADWAKKAGVDPFVLARSIGEKGTRPSPFVEPGFIKAQPRVDAYLERESRRLIQ